MFKMFLVKKNPILNYIQTIDKEVPVQGTFNHHYLHYNYIFPNYLLFYETKMTWM